jgi:hypothetical protein
MWFAWWTYLAQHMRWMRLTPVSEAWLYDQRRRWD